MKKLIYLTLLCCLTQLNAQSWQWGKRGGGMLQIDQTGGLRQEETTSVVTDSNKNIYGISTVNTNNITIDGHNKTSLDYASNSTDCLLYSLGCDGSYRWSKLFTGYGYEHLTNIQIDAQDNIYLTGLFYGGGGGSTAYPSAIENDITFPQSPPDYDIAFIMKYNSSGVMQWFKRLQPANNDDSTFISLSTDNNGNSYALTKINSPGLYCDGAFTNTLTGSNFYVLKYDANGNYISATYLDLQLTNFAFFNMQFVRNPHNGYFYITSFKGDSSDTAVVGGQTIANSAFIACFNTLGQFQWVRQNTYAGAGGLVFYNLAFDPQNNIYIGGKILGFGLESFIGLTVPDLTVPGFIMKVNPTADTMLWGSYNNTGTSYEGAIVYNNNEVGYTSYCSTTNFTWGSQVLNASNINNNEGTETLLARFNATTGACIGLSKISGDPGYDDLGTALAVDASGDYILGGGFGHQLTFTTNSILNIGQQSDFFVAKYSTSVCSLSTTDFKEEGLELYPNPVENTVKINSTENLTYTLYNMTGQTIKQGKITEQENTIDFSQLAQGTYLLQTTNSEGAVKKVKLLKK